ncbi:MAG: protein translocase subunit SecF [Halorhodospira halophila]|uniref:protein translocase subunit SecF n=1 Tax=Halorhodospira TaxID=85108 RepID=UPI00191468F0|nr:MULTISPECIES: protein translocase subunit SecF [Halorhodospira]MBK5937343.1 protein translocase subunit SecF [Halorhodospira halophila]MCC3750403.1 protein translocase subunit SecF [Halorhodospira halophila]MCG5527875.1 protein translocase subunit SecF [Halorhodospira halophila]MCG5533203.1 protein translocase subunit SecF [Halorhodospira sp. 9621]MCG5536954.1 protein translocase subunit SecF [Halorhodospira sp. 9622]
MEIFKNDPNFDFLGRRRIGFGLSAVLLVLSIGSLLWQGLNLGIDFTGGTLVEVGYEESVEVAEVEAALQGTDYADAQVLHFGSPREIMVRIPPMEDVEQAAVSEEILAKLREAHDGVELRRVEFVGPQIGRELTEQGLLALLYALGGVLVYVAFRFEYRFALGAVAALVHDIVLILGFFSLTRLTFDLTVLAALLATIGYSLNDTIVVSDRIRENFLKVRKGTTEYVMNLAINQTLSRTLVTSFTTLLVVGSLLLLGGEIIHGFAMALLVGVLVGTYSSIFIASASSLAMGVSKQDLLPPEKEGQDQEDHESAIPPAERP